jgi:3-hydroxybutyrate dehydrogenase
MKSTMLSGKTALVTGSTSGIGLGIARALAEQGANIVFNGFGDAQQIEKLYTDIGQEFGVSTAYHNADMSKPEQIEAMMRFAAEKFGGVDILVNNAGIQHVANVDEFPVEKWDAIIAINLTSAFHTSRLALPGMKQKNWGRIINLASVHGLVGSAGKSAYVAAKHGLVGFTKVTALENAHTGVTCNAICPGWVLTPLVQKQVDDRAAREGISERAGQEGPAEREAAVRRIRHAGRTGRAGRVLLLAGRRPGARRGLEHGWRLGRAVIRPGAGFNVDAAHLDASSIAQYTDKAKSQSTVDFLLNIIPNTFVDAFAKGDILQVLLIAILFGVALSMLGERGRPMTKIIDDFSHVIFGVVNIVMKLAPLGAFGAMAFTIGKYGLASLIPLAKLMGSFYLTCGLFVVVVLGTIARMTGFSIFKFIGYIKEELLIVLGTSSSESALPALMRKLEKLGCSKSVVGLVVPTGYSFNLDGTNIYMTMAALFVAQATNTELTLMQQLTILAVAMLTSKGASGITGAGFITLAATLAVVPTIPGGRHGADPRHRPLHERMPRADQLRRQRRGLGGGVEVGERAGQGTRAAPTPSP